MSVTVNIVSFDVPYPPDYGGVIDVYWKLYWLKRAGVEVHLHCYTKSRPPAKELEALCASVHYYPRKPGLISHFSTRPFTVVSRPVSELRRNLLSNDHPVLFEVLHTCALLADPAFAGRKKIYRHSNIEHEYYKGLSKSARSPLKRLYLRMEAWKLRRFEPVLRHAGEICAVNEWDAGYFRERYPGARTHYITSFHQNERVDITEGRNGYALFHGNLSIPENYEAVEWLARNVFPGLEYPVVVAGKDPPAFLRQRLKRLPNVRLVASPPADEMDILLRNAQVHVLYTRQATGLKLKLLNTLFVGRFIVCNPAMLAGTGLGPGDSVRCAVSAGDFADAVNGCMKTDFSGGMIDERRRMTAPFDNQVNAERLVRVISGSPAG